MPTVLAKHYASICIDYLIHNTQPADDNHLEYWKQTGFTGYRQFWEQVKNEINNL